MTASTLNLDQLTREGEFLDKPQSNEGAVNYVIRRVIFREDSFRPDADLIKLLGDHIKIDEKRFFEDGFLKYDARLKGQEVYVLAGMGIIRVLGVNPGVDELVEKIKEEYGYRIDKVN